jgi:hypothetical protein
MALPEPEQGMIAEAESLEKVVGHGRWSSWPQQTYALQKAMRETALVCFPFRSALGSVVLSRHPCPPASPTSVTYNGQAGFSIRTQSK